VCEGFFVILPRKKIRLQHDDDDKVCGPFVGDSNFVANNIDCWISS
jgi:sensor histidine kinase regulating citrate/malate metabolism